MEKPTTSQLMLAVLSFLAIVRISSCCVDTPPCAVDDARSLEHAMKKYDTKQVCRLLPMYMQCLHNALEACEKDQRLSERGDYKSLKILPLKLKQMKKQYSNMCPGHAWNVRPGNNVTSLKDSALAKKVSMFFYTSVVVLHHFLPHLVQP